jgi:hypothetical protein
VQELRKIVKERALNHLITPRATLDGCKLLQAGFSWDDVESMVCFKGLEADTVASIKQGLKKPNFEKFPFPSNVPKGGFTVPKHDLEKVIKHLIRTG